MKYWFTSDYHLGHANIIRYCNRPFKDVYHMNEVLIKNHNQRVSPNDTVFFLGDFCFRNSKGGKQGEGLTNKAEYYLNQLNGKIVLVKGNHDRNNSLKSIIERVVINYGGSKINLVHNPEHLDSKYPYNFVGHIHTKYKFKKTKRTTVVNVGVDVWNFKPISYDEIMKDLRRWEK